MTRKIRLLGLVPLILILIHYWHLVSKGEAGNLLWICHVSNIILATGLFFNIPELIRISLVSITLGIPMWIMDSIARGYVYPCSIFSHLSGLLIGIFVIKRVGANKKPGFMSYSLISFFNS